MPLRHAASAAARCSRRRRNDEHEAVRCAAARAPERVAETGSTNADLLARVRAAAASGATASRPCLLVAERQTAGRGRHGRAWHATPDASLTFSLAWPLAPRRLSGLSLAVGVALAEALDPRAGDALRIGLKWPNDLWLRRWRPRSTTRPQARRHPDRDGAARRAAASP